jgi:putative DNA primase/helicase
MPKSKHRPIDMAQLRHDTSLEVEQDTVRRTAHRNGSRVGGRAGASIRASTEDDGTSRVEARDKEGALIHEEATQTENTLWQQLEAEYGAAVDYQHNGEVSRLYENFWAARYRHDQAVIFDDVRQAFYLYMAGAYKEVSEDEIRNGLAKLLLRVGRLLNLDGLQKFRNARTLSGVITTLRAQVEHEPFARDPRRFIVLTNGVLRLHDDQEPEFVCHSPEFRSTHSVPFDYEPQARCPRFKEELLVPMLPQADDRKLVRRYFGMCLLGRNLAQRLLLLRGDGADGKTQLVNVLTGLIGRESTLQLRSDQLGQRFEMGMIGSKSLLVGIDVQEDFLGAERSEVIKALVGGDTLMAEVKGSMREERVKGDKCMIVTSNGKLRVKLRGDTVAWRRRLIVLECAPPPRDRRPIAEFGQMLLAQEGPGILNWALAGLRELLNGGGQIDLNEEQRERVDTLLGEGDALAIYLRDSLETARDSNTTERTDLTVDEIWNGYVAFCKVRDWGMMPKRTVDRSLTELVPRLFQGRHSNNVCDPQSSGRRVRGYRGVRWRDGRPPEGYQDTDSGLYNLNP